MEGSPEGRVPLTPAAQARGAGAAQARENETESENVAKDDETAAAFFCARGGRAKSYQEKRASSYTLPRGACYDNSRKQEAARQGAGLPENYYEKE